MNNIKCDVTCIHEDVVKIVNKKKNDIVEVEKTATLFKILGDKTRLQIVDILIGRELCVCDIACILDMTQSSISHQLRKLKNSNIVESRKEGLNVFYYLKDQHIIELYLTAFRHTNVCDN